jgi:thioredoxin reductase (NADPH)
VNASETHRQSSFPTPVALLDGDDPALFPKLTEQQLQLLTTLGQVRETAVDEVLFRDGDAGYDPMVVLAGRVAVLEPGGDESRELVSQRAGDLMVELNLFTGQPVGATGVVREAGSVLVVPAPAFRELVGRELVFGDFVLQLLFRRRQALERLLLGIRIVGSRFDRDTHRLREFAARNRVAHEWVDSDEPRARKLLGALALTAGSGPIVLLGGTRAVSNPSNAELADALGLQQAPLPSETTFDLVIVGAGPAGLAASVYGASSGFSTVVLDAVAVGGQAATSARIENYLGFPAGISGAELAERCRIQADKFGVHFVIPRRAIRLSERAGFYKLDLDNDDELVARAAILALGVQYRRLPIPSLADYEGLGVAYATDSAREQLRPGDDAMVVGGANSAGQAALALAEDGRHVYLVAREDTLARTMAAYLRDRIEHEPAIEVLLGHQVRSVKGDDHLERVVLEQTTTGDRQTRTAGALVVLIGATPHTDWLPDSIALDSDGFVLTGPDLGTGLRDREPWQQLGRDPFLLETSLPGVFAVGDVRSGGTRMAAPAVGEGGMAVRLAAEHLARTTPPPPGHDTSPDHETTRDARWQR